MPAPLTQRFQRLMSRVDRYTWVIFVVVNLAVFAVNYATGRSSAATPVLVSSKVRVAICAVNLVAQAVVLRWRKQRPVTVFAAATALYLLNLLLIRFDIVFTTFSYLFAIFSLAGNNRVRHRLTMLGLATAATGALGAVNLALYYPVPSEVLPAFATNTLAKIVGAFGTLALLGGWHGSARRQSELSAANAELTRQTADARTAAATVLERSRMARELHDISGHHLSLIGIQAQSLLQRHDLPDAVREKIEIIDGETESALQSTRIIVKILRQPADATEHDMLPQLSRLPNLLADFTEHHADVDVETHGDLDAINPNTSLACWRIVQESITNAHKHSPGATIQVRIERGRRQITVEVRNGPPPQGTESDHGSGGGFGLVGMKERATLLGGSLSSGPTDDGGWYTQAVIPIDPDKAAI